jgi:hypothetical protein
MTLKVGLEHARSWALEQMLGAGFAREASRARRGELRGELKNKPELDQPM